MGFDFPKFISSELMRISSAIVSTMRIFGVFLLVAGIALCATIVWATIGFLAMSMGLICLQIPSKPSSIPITAVEENAAGLTRKEPPVDDPLDQPAILPVRSESTTAWEERDWRALVDQDEELAQIERLLLRYGTSYADHLRELYVVHNDKALLPSILHTLIESVRQEVTQTDDGALLPDEHKREISKTVGTEQTVVPGSPLPRVSTGKLSVGHTDREDQRKMMRKTIVDLEDSSSLKIMLDDLSRNK